VPELNQPTRVLVEVGRATDHLEGDGPFGWREIRRNHEITGQLLVAEREDRLQCRRAAGPAVFRVFSMRLPIMTRRAAPVALNAPASRVRAAREVAPVMFLPSVAVILARHFGAPRRDRVAMSGRRRRRRRRRPPGMGRRRARRGRCRRMGRLVGTAGRCGGTTITGFAGTAGGGGAGFAGGGPSG